MSGEKRDISKIDKVRNDIKETIIHVIGEMSPSTLIKRNLKIRDYTLIIARRYRVALENINKLYIVGFGKASGAMATEAEKILGRYLSNGCASILRGTKKRYFTKKVRIYEADHPIPSEDNLKAAEEIVKLLENSGEKDVVIVLISGGGSALLTLPKEGFSLSEIADVTRTVMNAGATINELNAVRKHLSKVKGGQLLRYAYPAEVYSLILSDVVGDPLDTIASGPTSPDTTTYRDAYNVLVKYNLVKKVPEKVLEHFKAGIEGSIDETPKPGDKIFSIAHNVIIGNNEMALSKTANIFRRKGYRVKILSTYIEGEARHIGTLLAGIALEISKHNRPFRKPVVLLGGGETTVTVKGKGIGGRNQELVLSSGIKISGNDNIIIASVGTDGIDGNSPAAGAIIDGKMMEKALEANIDPRAYLINNDSYNFFKEVGGAIVTGPTGTNINDIIIITII